jgi:PAS domain S-box-containing protein
MTKNELSENLPMAIFAADREGRLRYHLPLVTYTNLFDFDSEITVWMSPQVEAITGYPPSQWIEEPGFFASILHPDDRNTVLKEVTASRNELRPFSLDYRLIARSGETVWVQDESVPVLDHAGVPEFIQGYFVDLTDRKALEENLLHAQKTEALGLMAATIAHDFNNHLMVIACYAALIRKELIAGCKAMRDLDELVLATARSKTLTQQLLAFCRHEHIEPRPTDLRVLIDEFRGMLCQVAGPEIKLIFELNPAPLIRVDPGQLEQIIMNLVTNGRDAMPEGGTLSIRSELAIVRPGRESARLALDPGEYGELVVADTGTGIEPGVLRSIFDPFFTTKGRKSGTGLGLSMVNSVVRQGGGAIDVVSNEGGTTFRILFPAT